MTSVLDASAVLAFLSGEPGGDQVENALAHGVVGAANWSEVAQKVISRGADWEIVRRLLLSYGLTIEPVTEADAVEAARRWRPGLGLSLGDRLCLALGKRLGAPILTADKAWGEDAPIIQIR